MFTNSTLGQNTQAGTAMHYGLRIIVPFLLIGCQAAQQDGSDEIVEKELQGRVFDEAGMPVVGAEVSFFWRGLFQDPVPAYVVRTDQLGRFSTRLEWSGTSKALLVMDKARHRGTLAIVSENSFSSPMAITVSPLFAVDLFARCEELSQAPEWMDFFIEGPGGSGPFLACRTRGGQLSLQLPSGEYRVGARGEGTYNRTKAFTVLSGHRQPEPVTIELKASTLGLFRGKAPPAWKASDARGATKDVKLSDYKGKWVLLDFWSWKCFPCTHVCLPELVDFWENHKEDQDHFQILAIHHDKQVKSLEELDQKLKKEAGDPLKGKIIPFPLVLDTTGETFENFRIELLPTELLIDPEGKLIEEGYGRCEAMLETKLKEYRKQPK